MFHRTTITLTPVLAGAHKALAALGVLFFISCTSNTTIHEIEELPQSTDPLSFTCRLDESGVEQTTRASSLLTSDFRASVYKAFATAKQQTVMNGYHVEYKTTGTAWDGNVRPYWDYTTVAGQHQKYWDYQNFPYRFHAVAPYTAATSEVAFDDTDLTINAPYYYQTCHNGTVQTRDAMGTITTAKAEPYIISQLQRRTDGTDQDLLARRSTTINNQTTTKHREVWMPFHHLNSKIRFAVYSLHPWLSANYTYITDLSVKVSSSNFSTTATGYHASCNATGNWRVSPPYDGTNGFTGVTKTSGPGPEIFRFDGGPGVAGNDLRTAQTQATAYFLQCKDGFMQIPQKDVEMTVSCTLRRGDGSVYKTYTDIPVSLLLDGSYQPHHDWLPGYIYTYYLVISGVDDKLELQFTCTLTDWDDIPGSLSTDLEQ